MKTCSRCKLSLELKNFSKNKSTKSGIHSWCKKCVIEYSDIYSNTEHGYLNNLYGYLRRREFQKRYINYPEYEKARRRCYITKEEFFNLWNEHKKKHGYTCALTGESIVFKTSSPTESKTNNGVSVDRLNPKIGYTLENTIFVSNRTNQMKCNVTKELCAAIIRAHEERGL